MYFVQMDSDQKASSVKSERPKAFSYEKTDVPDTYIKNSGREMNARYQEKLVMKVLLRFASKLFVPGPCGRLLRR